MSGVNNPATRPTGHALTGHALVVAHPSTRGTAASALHQLGFTCDFADDPYAAIVTLCRAPEDFQAVVLGLAGLFKEELAFIESVKRRFGASEVWLTQTDGRQATLVEAMRLGADALLSDEGLYRLSTSGVSARSASAGVSTPTSAFSSSWSTAATLSVPGGWPAELTEKRQNGAAAVPLIDDPSNDPANDPVEPDDALSNDITVDEPVLTADELRALLHEPHSYGGGDE